MVTEMFPLAMLAFIGSRAWVSPRHASVMTGVGLMTASALLVHLADGMTEMHFHFFVMLGVISLYQDWRPFLLSIAYVALHHGLVGVLSPHDVFDHEAAWSSPWSGRRSTPSSCWRCRPYRCSPGASSRTATGSPASSSRRASVGSER